MLLAVVHEVPAAQAPSMILSLELAEGNVQEGVLNAEGLLRKRFSAGESQVGGSKSVKRRQIGIQTIHWVNHFHGTA